MGNLSFFIWIRTKLLSSSIRFQSTFLLLHYCLNSIHFLYVFCALFILGFFLGIGASRQCGPFYIYTSQKNPNLALTCRRWFFPRCYIIHHCSNIWLRQLVQPSMDSSIAYNKWTNKSKNFSVIRINLEGGADLHSCDLALSLLDLKGNHYLWWS